MTRAGVVLLAVLAAAIGGCGDDVVARDQPVKIPYLSSAGGPGAGFKQDMLVPRQLVLAQLRQRADGDLPEIEFERLEDNLDPTQAVRNFRNAMRDDPLAILTVASNTSAAIAPLANDRGVPMIATGASKVDIATDNRPWVFTPWANQALTQGRAVKSWLELEPDVKRVVLIENDQEAASKTQGDAAAKSVQAAGGELVGTVTFNTSTTDFAPLIARAASMRPDGIIVGSTPPQATSISEAIRKQGLDASVYLVQNALAQGFFTTVGDNADGFYGGTEFFAGAKTPTVQRYVEAFEARSGGVRPTYPQIYDGYEFLLAAIREADVEGKPIGEARAAVRDALDRVCITAVTGNRECFNDDGYVEKPSILIRIGKGGDAVIAKEDAGS